MKYPRDHCLQSCIIPNGFDGTGTYPTDWITYPLEPFTSGGSTLRITSVGKGVAVDPHNEVKLIAEIARTDGFLDALGVPEADTLVERLQAWIAGEDGNKDRDES